MCCLNDGQLKSYLMEITILRVESGRWWHRTDTPTKLCSSAWHVRRCGSEIPRIMGGLWWLVTTIFHVGYELKNWWYIYWVNRLDGYKLILTSLLVSMGLSNRSPAKNLVHFLQGIWLIGNGNGRNGYITSNNVDLPSGKHSQFAIEAMATEIVDLPINSMVIFHSFLYVYQRVMDLNGI